MGKTNKNIRDDRKDKTLKSINGGIQKNKGFSLSKERMKLIWHLLINSKKDVSNRYSSGDSFSKCFDEATGLNLLGLVRFLNMQRGQLSCVSKYSLFNFEVHTSVTLFLSGSTKWILEP